MASGSHDGTVRLWDLNASSESGEGRVLLDVSPQAARSVAFSPDGKLMVVGLAEGAASNPEYSLRLIETETGSEIRRLAGHSEVVADVAFSPDGKRILSASVDTSIIIWDAASGAEIQRLIGHNSSVIAVAFHPEGRLAVTGGVNGTILLWDLEEGVVLRRYANIHEPILEFAFTPGGGSFWVAAESNAHEFRVDATQDELLAWIVANRYVPELTCQQRKQYGVELPCD